MVKRTARIQDVARKAGVSPATVSYVLNNRGRVSLATRDRVYEAVEALGYHPSARARSLALRQSKIVGVTEPAALPPSDPSFALFLSGIADACRQDGYHVMLIASGGTESGPSLEAVAQSGVVDGIIVTDIEEGDPRLETLNDVQLPYIVFGHAPNEPWVDIDHVLGAEMATRHLLDFGHQRIAHLALPPALIASSLRQQGYERALGSAAEPLEPMVRWTNGTFEAGYQATRELLGRPDRPTAIFAASDSLALGAMRSALDMGFNIPRQLSVVGFDDTWNARHADPPLTSVAYDIQMLGRETAARLLARLRDEVVPSLSIHPALVTRASAGPIGFFGTPPTDAEEPVLKAGATYAVWSTHGTLDPSCGRHGVYLADTRMVSDYQVWIGDQVLAPIHMTATRDGRSFDAVYVWQEPLTTFRIHRHLAFRHDGLTDAWTWSRWGEPRTGSLRVQITSDFSDVFEIRGTPRSRHGNRSLVESDQGWLLVYDGLDDIRRTLEVDVSPPPAAKQGDGCRWELPLDKDHGQIRMVLHWDNPAYRTHRVLADALDLSWPTMLTGQEEVDGVLSKARQDLTLLLTDYGHGPVPMAGLPWFGTLFGRDSLVVGWQTLAWQPAIAQRVVRTLAAFQGTEDRPDTEEEPGKIVHEIRLGEMARTGEVPFHRYYGSVDSTPLFVALFAATWIRGADDAWLRAVLPAVERSLDWLERKAGPQGLYDFLPRSERGLAVQSWKDSSDSMVFRNGDHGAPPLAVAEVQGYTYMAFLLMARCYRAWGEHDRAERLEQRARMLQQRFHDAFWLPDRQYYALAVDGRGAQVDGLSSDPGECLWTGIVPEATAPKIAAHLVGQELFSGWGIRTLGSDEGAYDPYSYHRGSIWPHDTSLVVAGLRRVGEAEGAARVAAALFAAAVEFPGQRLPELFSGESRAHGGPFPYPTACAPQAWASGSPFLLLEALTGFTIDALTHTVTLAPVLPDTWPGLEVRGVSVGGQSVTLICYSDQVAVEGLPEGWHARCEPLKTVPIGGSAPVSGEGPIVTVDAANVVERGPRPVKTPRTIREKR